MDQSAVPVPTTPPLVSVEAFYGVIRVTVVYLSRIVIRIVCFKRLFVEDYLMLVSLCFLLAGTIVGQPFVKYIYQMVDVSNGAMPPLTFLDDTTNGLRGFGSLVLLNYFGIWLVKLNFLLFFRRLGNHVDKYRIFWWVVLLFNLAAGVVVIGLIDFPCTMRPAEVVFANCNGPKSAIASSTAAKVTCALDAFGDGLIICFPCWILWGCKLNIRKKFALTGIFGLVALTIAVTIIRGSIFGGVYRSISEHEIKQINVTWIWFWFDVEFVVAFTIGCLVSFRALYAQKSSSAQERQHRAALNYGSKPKGLRARARLLRDDLITTLMTWEATTGANEDRFELPRPPTGRLSVDFQQGETWSKPSTSHKHSDSLQASNAQEFHDQV
ncbi:hypothetical protein GGR53DRAFT_524296 [Hypoxylon sp. FL1150]|nr:hypothetical protein GGR53DRAFT_524296 [Hypoxylon sp. FL1150]